ncbi:MAG: hypothetical protein OES79_07225, partial [Planctomycetota bacterium]|nr:hypothetical protein [Planctomycetota bacterium]
FGPASQWSGSSRTPLATIPAAESLLDSLVPAIQAAIAEPASPYAHLITLDGEFVRSGVEQALETSPADQSATNASRYQSDHLLDPPPALPNVETWPAPETLQWRLGILDAEPDTRSWSRAVRGHIDRLVASEYFQDEAAAAALAELTKTIPWAQKLAAHIHSDRTRAQLNGAIYDLQRRLHVWQAAHDLATALPRKKKLVVVPVVEVARLGKLPGPATAMVNLSGLLAQVEQYEHSRLPSDGRRIADAIQVLQSSAQTDHRTIGNRLDQHYRNANFRVAVSGNLINRLTPGPQRDCRPVNEQIMGLPVWGDSSTFTKVHVRLLPDSRHIRLGVEAWGRVNAQTTTASGPVHVHSDARSDFVVRKLLLLDDEGLKAKRTVAEANSTSDLVGIESEYDRVPIVRGIVRNMAEREHDEMHGAALRIAEAKVAAAARTRFDAQVVPRVQKAASSFYQELWEPLVKLGLEPTAIDRHTTRLRAVTRLRVGNELQLTGHTARPRAPSDSWASMQIHETVLNNGLQQLELDGKTMSLEELYRYIARRLDRPVKEIPDTMPSNVYVSFAAQDAVRVRCEDGSATLTLGLAEVRKGTNRWRNLLIRGNYAPAVEGLSAGLVRTGPILLVGHRLRTRDQVALRGVFSKLLSKSHQLNLVPDDLAKDKRLVDMAITQAEIKDGWIGVAMGPVRRGIAAHTAAARQ